jgi:hypothetical protein
MQKSGCLAQLCPNNVPVKLHFNGDLGAGVNLVGRPYERSSINCTCLQQGYSNYNLLRF